MKGLREMGRLDGMGWFRAVDKGLAKDHLYDDGHLSRAICGRPVSIGDRLYSMAIVSDPCRDCKKRQKEIGQWHKMNGKQ